jgi:hypothetical protein
VKSHARRGQVLPFWTVAIASILALAGGVLTYGNQIAWHIRAQNAADAAALGAIGIQTQQINTMNMLLYSAAIEEFRVRYLLNGTILAMHLSGGCMPKPYTPANDCQQEFEGEAERFVPAVNRYSNVVNMLNNVTQTMSVAHEESDMTEFVAAQKNTCGTVTGGDCSFNYEVTKFATRSGVDTVDADAYGMLLPNELRSSAATYSTAFFAPIEVEVAVCVKNPTPLLWSFGLPAGHVIARSAAEAVIVVQDWMQPGQISDPNSAPNQVDFQAETQETNWYTSTEQSGLSAGGYSSYYDWFTTTFGGNANTPNSTTMRFSSTITQNEYSARTGWWDAMLIKPFSGALSGTAVSTICT